VSLVVGPAVAGAAVGRVSPAPTPASPARASGGGFRNILLRQGASAQPAPARLDPAPPRQVARAGPAAVLVAHTDVSRRGVLAQGRERLPPGATKDDDPLDPLHRHHATLAAPDSLALPSVAGPPDPLAGSHTAGATAPSARAAASLEDLVPALVRRIAWSGDRQRGSVRLELGAGELAGATLLVQAEGGRVRVHLNVPPGVDAGRWQRRISRRLASRGVATDAVEVT
jgi:hypothetical protein